MDNHISVIIPTYNERENISDIIDLVFKEIKPLKEIIIVDDDSPDLTWQLVEEIRKDKPQIKLFRRLNESVLPTAIWKGILSSQGEIILWLDADFLSLPSTLTRWLDYFNGYDIAVASRYVEGGQDTRIEKIRVITSKLFNNIAQFILQTNTRDLTSGYIIARKEIFKKVNISGLYGEYSIKFLYQAEKANFRIKEVPYICLSRNKGKSKTSANILSFIKFGLIYILTVFKLKIFKK